MELNLYALRIQCGYRQHAARERVRMRVYARADAAKVENIIKRVQEEVVGQQSSVGATAGTQFTCFTSTKVLAAIAPKILLYCIAQVLALLG